MVSRGLGAGEGACGTAGAAESAGVETQFLRKSGRLTETGSWLCAPGRVRRALSRRVEEAGAAVRPRGLEDRPPPEPDSGCDLSWACHPLAASRPSLMICPLKKHGERQSGVFPLHPGFSSQEQKRERVSRLPFAQDLLAFAIFLLQALRLALNLQSSTAATPERILILNPVLIYLSFPAHHSNDSPRSSRNIVARTTAIPQIRVFTCADTTKDHT